jgi:hypothetical protein
MTTKTGRVTIQLSESRLDGELLLRSNGVPTPAGAATNFLAGQGIGDNDFATVTGTEAPSGGEIALFIQTAVRAAAPALAAAPTALIAKAAARSARRAPGKKTRKPVKVASSRKKAPRKPPKKKKRARRVRGK